MSSVCCCRRRSKDLIETKTDDHGDKMEMVKHEMKKVRRKIKEEKQVASAANTGVSEDTGEKRRRSRRLSMKEEMKDLADVDDSKVSTFLADSEGVVKELPVKQETELDELRSIKDEVVYRCPYWSFLPYPV